MSGGFALVAWPGHGCGRSPDDRVQPRRVLAAGSL